MKKKRLKKLLRELLHLSNQHSHVLREIQSRMTILAAKTESVLPLMSGTSMHVPKMADEMIQQIMELKQQPTLGGRAEDGDDEAIDRLLDLAESVDIDHHEYDDFISLHEAVRKEMIATLCLNSSQVPKVFSELADAPEEAPADAPVQGV